MVGSDGGQPGRFSSLLSGDPGVPALGALRLRGDPSTDAGAHLGRVRPGGGLEAALLGSLRGPARSGSSIPNSHRDPVFHELLCFHSSLWARCQLPFVLACLF